MIEHNVNRQAIDQIVLQMDSMTGQGQYNLSDVLLGVTEHLRQTLAAGYASKGYNMGGFM